MPPLQHHAAAASMAAVVQPAWAAQLKHTCRGVLVAAATNAATTQMIEAQLARRLGHGNVFLQSTGDEHIAGGGAAARLHPLARAALLELDAAAFQPRLEQQFAKVLGRRQREQFDVLLRVVRPGARSGGWGGPLARGNHDGTLARETRYDAAAEVRRFGSAESSSPPPEAALAPVVLGQTPAHWRVSSAAGVTLRSQVIWSTDDDVVANTGNMKHRFTDEYQGEPMFEVRRQLVNSKSWKLEDTWELPDVARRLPMESEAAQYDRFRAVRDDIERRIDDFLPRLKERFCCV